MRNITKIIWVPIITSLLLAGCSTQVDETVRDDNGKILESGDMGALKIKVGDCINGIDIPEQTDTFIKVDTVKGVPCSGPHHWEAISTTQSNLSSYNSDAVIKEAVDYCSSPESFSFLNSKSEDELNQINEKYANASTFYTFPLDEYTWDNQKEIMCFTGSDSEYYEGSIRD